MPAINYMGDMRDRILGNPGVGKCHFQRPPLGKRAPGSHTRQGDGFQTESWRLPRRPGRRAREEPLRGLQRGAQPVALQSTGLRQGPAAPGPLFLAEKVGSAPPRGAGRPTRLPASGFLQVCFSSSLGRGSLLSPWPDETALLRNTCPARTRTAQPHDATLSANYSGSFHFPLYPHFPPCLRRLGRVHAVGLLSHGCTWPFQVGLHWKESVR